MAPAAIIAVAGAGTMGAGIAQLAAQSGARTLLYDPDPAARERGLEAVRAGVARAAAKGRCDPGAADAVELVASVDQLAGAELAIEAAPENLALKQELLSAIAAAAGDEIVLATNTSSLSVTALAAAVPVPARVVGMHFFNPAPVMRLLEVVAGGETSQRALALARATGEAMGRHVIDAADGPGFLVNRCNRPFSLEAQRLVTERVASAEQVDRICRMAGGFRMGPFELMDLVGLDVGLEVARSFYAQSFGEPRWRPSPLAAGLVAAGRLGRKSGRGFHAHPHDPADPEPPAPRGERGRILLCGAPVWLRERSRAAGWELVEQDAPRLCSCASASLSAQDAGDAVGFVAIAPGGRLLELTRGPGTGEATMAAAERLARSLGMHPEWVGDAPGLVSARIVAQLVNEACFAVGEGIGTPEAVDAGMVLGLNHPRGPLEWGDAIGPSAVLAIIDGLWSEYREERYRAAPLLRRAASGGDDLR